MKTKATRHLPGGQQTARGRRHAVYVAAALLTVVVLAAILGVGYAVGGRHGGQEANGGVAAPAQTSSTNASHLAVPDFAITAAPFVGGGRFVLSQHADKPTLIYFMASWCATCVPEARAIAQLQSEIGQQANFVVLDIDPGDTLNDLEHFWKAVGSPGNIWALDKDGRVTTAYNVTSLDTTIIIAGGKEVARTVGGRSASQLKAMLANAGGIAQ
jgi:thiol-disulfide isomerase/thioredoxin